MPEPSKGKKCPRDPAQLAKFVVDVATGEIEDREPTPEEQRKDPAAVSLGRRGGIKGIVPAHITIRKPGGDPSYNSLPAAILGEPRFTPTLAARSAGSYLVHELTRNSAAQCRLH
jgi:hypothetical protein